MSIRGSYRQVGNPSGRRNVEGEGFIQAHIIHRVDHPVRMLSKNFLAHYQLDIHLCTEFLCTWYRQHCPSRLVCR
jgi:hypothetical protein